MSRVAIPVARRAELVAVLTNSNYELGPLDREDLLKILTGADDLVAELGEVVVRAEAFIAPLENEPVHEEGLSGLLTSLRNAITKVTP